MTQGRLRTSSPRNPIPGNRRVRAASSANASTIEALDRRVRCASASIVRSVASVKRTLNGSPFSGLLRSPWDMEQGYHTQNLPSTEVLIWMTLSAEPALGAGELGAGWDA